MSIQLPNAAAIQFEAEVKHAFQGMGGDLENTVRVKSLVNAKTHTFNVMGKGLAAERGALHTEIPLMNVSHTPVTVTTKNYTAAEMTDIFSNEQTPVDERLELAQTIAQALKRRQDQLIIDALEASGTAIDIAKNVSGANANLTVDAIRAAARELDDNNVPDGDRTLVVSPSALHALLGNTEATSSDFMNVKALTTGDLDTFYGFKIIKIGKREEGGLPLSGTERTLFAYHKSAVGLAVNMEPKVTVNWDDPRGAWRTTGYLSANAVAIDNEGIGKITVDEAL